MTLDEEIMTFEENNTTFHDVQRR